MSVESASNDNAGVGGGGDGLSDCGISASNGIRLIVGAELSGPSLAFGSSCGTNSGSGGICLESMYNLAMDCRSREI